MDYRTSLFEHYASAIKGYASKFDEAAARWTAAFQHYLRNWLPEDRNATIVDLACGDGKFLYLLRQSGYANVIGVDISPEQTALASQVHDGVIQSDVLAFLADRQEEFELLVGLDIIEHFTKDEAFRFLEAAHRALRPGGRLILNTPNAASPFGIARRYGDFSHELAFSPSCLAGVLRLFSFEQIEARELGPYLHGLTSAVRLVLWRLLRSLLVLYNYVEIGKPGEGPLTRNVLMSAVKRHPAKGRIPVACSKTSP